MDTPQRRIQKLKQVVVEWIVTNGSLPGFQERLDASKHLWKVVGSEGLIVYRGQGHSKPGIPNRGDPSTLVNGIRPIVASTKSIDVAKQYMGSDCCLFEIQITPGVRYLDAKELFTFPDRESGTLVTNVSNEVIDTLIELLSQMSDSYWLKKAIASGNGRNVIRGIFLERLQKEEEILLDGSQGGFTVTPYMFKAKYLRKGRGRTFRTKALRRNKKNGHRVTRKSQDRRDVRS